VIGTSLCIVCLATGLVTVYVFQEPSLLSSLQDNGLTDVVLHALLVKDVRCYLFYLQYLFFFPVVSFCCIWLYFIKHFCMVSLSLWIVGSHIG